MNHNDQDSSVQHSSPIPITGARRRAASVSSSSASSVSPRSSPLVQTPLSASTTHFPNVSPSTSPILSYFMTSSPTKGTNATFPFKRGFSTTTAPVFEEEEPEPKVPVAAHARRASTVVAGRFGQQQQPPMSVADSQRGAGLLRRLSLSTAFNRNGNQLGSPTLPPSPPPNSAVTQERPSFVPTLQPPLTPRGKVRRSTLNVEPGSRPRRAPSPMGERILKGHFDGFN